VFPQVRHHQLRIDVALQRQLDSHVVCGHVLDVDERRQLAREDDLGDPFHQRRLVHHVRHAGDVDRLAAASGLAHAPGAAYADGAGASLIDFLDLVGGVQDLPAGGEVGAFHPATELRRRQIGIVEELQQRRADLAEVMRRDARRHADGNAGRPVHQEVGNAGRQHDWLGARAIVVRAERDGVLIDLAEKLVAQARQPAFGVAHRRGTVAVERSEVARAVDERRSQRERLRHAHQRLVDRRVAVRMEAAHHVADHLRAFAVLGVRRQVLLPHRVEDAALDRLQPVADVRQRARGNH
jgi:hypothetical protein